MQAAVAQERVCKDPKPAANLDNLGADGLEFKLGFWITDPENSLNPLRSAICIDVLNGLRANNISIPYPQRTVHFVDEMPGAAARATPEDGQSFKPASGARPVANLPADRPHLPAP